MRKSTRLRAPALALIAATMALGGGLFGGDARAEHLIQIGQAKKTATVSVFIGKSEDVRTDSSFVELTVGDPEVADVNPLTDRSLSILGKKNGTTRVSAYAEGKKLIGVFDVEVVYDTSLLQTEIRRRFPHAGFRVTAVNGRIMLTGTSPDATTLDQAVPIAKQFGARRDQFGPGHVAAAGHAGGALRRGHAPGRPRPRSAMERVRQAQPRQHRQPHAERPASVTNSNPNLDSRFTQPDVPDGGRNVGTSSLGISPVVVAGVLSGTAPFGVMVSKLLAAGVETDVMINALEQKGVARALAEPNLVALSGDTASFLAGGEYPIPVPGALGTITIDYKRYGVGLAFTPTVLSDGLINLKIEPEVSQLDFSHMVTIGGLSVPPLIVRRAATTVELRDGQSFVIGGLLQSINQNAIAQMPWLGDLPVLGALFRSTSYQKQETDLAIIVTPRLVRPARPGDVIKTPLDSSLPPNDADLFLMGKNELTPAKARLVNGLAAARIHRSCARPAEGRRRCHLGPQLNRLPRRHCWV